MPPLLPRQTGFMPLNDNGNNDDGIPLSQMRTNASTGARKAAQTAVGIASSDDGDEKAPHSSSGIGGRRKQATGLSRSDTGSDVELNAMGRLYTKIVGFSPVMRYIVYVVPVAFLLAIPIVVLVLTDHRYDLFVGKGSNNAHGPPQLKLWIWIMVAWLTLWAGKIVAHIIPVLFLFLCGVVSSGTRKYATVLRNLEIPVSLFFWALASWISFKAFFHGYDKAGVSWVEILTKLLLSGMICSAVYLAEKAVVQMIGISYHQRSFANRIKDSKREVHLLGLLYDASRALFPMYCPEFEEEDYVITDSINLILSAGSKKRANAAPRKLIGDVGRLGDKVTSVFGNIASEITGKNVFNPNSAHSVVVEALEKKKSAEALARRIWMSFVVEDRDALLPEDVQEVLGVNYKDEADEAFSAIDNDGNGDISIDEMIRKVVDMSRERKAITEGMKDIGQALRAFDEVLTFCVFIASIFIFVLVFQAGFSTTLASAATSILTLSFVFSVTAQEFLGSCIFLFVKHPFDVGDRVEITDTSLMVEKISLLYTVFNRLDRNQVVQIPNIVLNSLWVENISRSKSMNETIDLNVSYDTSMDDVELLRQEMENFVRNPANSRDFHSDFGIGVFGVGDLDKLQLKITIKFKSNWHDEKIRAQRRGRFITALYAAVKKIPIHAPGGGGEPAGSAANPAYSVTITDEQASKNRKEAAVATDKSRMCPLMPENDVLSFDVGASADKLGSTNSMRRPQSPADSYLRADWESTAPSRRDSRRGLRMAGQSAPTAPLVTLSTPISPPPRMSADSRRNFDEEAQLARSQSVQTAEAGVPQRSSTLYTTVNLSAPQDHDELVRRSKSSRH
ncbi:putative MscS family protein C2C4.17c [Ceratocystis fimbriata CBS 114723]|uniref:Putative MscS family protein C2C4.17c n=1 Tax=Ceratocystis fimbriata CBS 114723 TaxID=1035309 RepID=A0A2C5WZ79_9PEZI|nr:putative MscS family protein C2C4.17c [Ceratocystis fimbriata CBS 114723]